MIVDLLSGYFSNSEVHFKHTIFTAIVDPVYAFYEIFSKICMKMFCYSFQLIDCRLYFSLFTDFFPLNVRQFFDIDKTLSVTSF